MARKVKKDDEKNHRGQVKPLKVEDFSPPPAEFFRKLTQPLRDYFTPEFIGLEKIEAGKPALYVSNHTIYGITDWTLFMAEVYRKKKVFLRTLSDNMHYTVPVWRELVEYFGMVPGSPETCSKLMENRQHILVFPGGGREVFRRKKEKYSLQWKKRTGFAHMAIQHGYDIIPVAQVGGDDTYDILADADDLQGTLFGKFLESSGIISDEKKAEYIPPLSKGLLGTFLPKPVKLYFSAGDRISTSEYAGDIKEEHLWAVRDKTELAMTQEIIRLLEHRGKDNSVGLLRKLLTKI